MIFFHTIRNLSLSISFISDLFMTVRYYISYIVMFPFATNFVPLQKNFFKLPNNSDIPIQYRNKDWIRHRAESDKKTMWKYTRGRKML